MVTERKIEEEGQEWHNKGRKSADLLQGSKLGEAEEYLKNYGHLGMLDGVAEECINPDSALQKVALNTTSLGLIIKYNCLSS